MHDEDPELLKAARALGIELDHVAELMPEHRVLLPADDEALSRWAGLERLLAEWVTEHLPQRIATAWTRRQSGKDHGQRLAGVSRLRVICDDWWPDERGMIEVHTSLSGEAWHAGPSCDLRLVRRGSHDFARADDAWTTGTIAGSDGAWFAWLVPGDAWTVELRDEALRRWLEAFVGRDDLQLCGLKGAESS